MGLSVQRVRIWDLPTRLFHAALLLLLVLTEFTAQIGADWMLWHLRLGSLLGVLLLFRLVWGGVGGRWSRFSHFDVTPRKLLAYVRGRTQSRWPGHNPLGALSVLTLLLLLAVQVGSGMLADDEVAYAGPWALQVSTEVSQWATAWHAHAGHGLLLGFIALHIAAVLFHQFLKGDDLIGPMRHGDRVWAKTAEGVEPSRDDMRSRVLALIIVGGCAGVWLFGLGGWPG